MPLPFPITAVDNPLGPGASSRVDVRTVDGTSTVGYANVTGDFRSTVVTGGEVLFALQDSQQTTTLRSALVGPSGTPASVVASFTRADATDYRSKLGVVQTSTGESFGFMASRNTSDVSPQIALFNASLSTTFTAEYYGGGGDASVSRIGWVSFDDGSIADIAMEAYV